VRSSGGFAGAYSSTQANGKSQAEVDYSFQYNCDPLDDSVSCTGGGSPRWSIPINTDQNGKVEGYAFIPPGCGTPGTVSTTSSTCAVTFEGITLQIGMPLL
jgi:hypothetical protein